MAILICHLKYKCRDRYRCKSSYFSNVIRTEDEIKSVHQSKIFELPKRKNIKSWTRILDNYFFYNNDREKIFFLYTYDTLETFSRFLVKN